MSVRFVKTLEEVRRLQKLYAQPEFEQFRGISAVFETDPDVIAAVLPPPLKPTDNPIASVSVSHIGLSNGLQPFGAAGLSVQCEYEGIVGDYPLTMPMSTDSAVIFGRELYGEPKKVADIQVRRNGDNIVGTVQRYGITYIELQGDVVEAGEPGDSGESSRFYFKYMPAPDGNGFDNDPVLVRVRHTGKTRLVERLDGEVLLRESAHDPVADIPMRKLLSMSYAEGDTYTHGEFPVSRSCRSCSARPTTWNSWRPRELPSASSRLARQGRRGRRPRSWRSWLTRRRSGRWATTKRDNPPVDAPA
jgi:acetoacetate decarboxylase